MDITPAIKNDFLKFEDETTLSQMIGKLKQQERKMGLVFKNNKYLGLVERKRLLRTSMNPQAIKLSSIFQKSPIVDEHSDVIEAANLMSQSGYDFLPVGRDKDIIGVINAIDLADLALQFEELSSAKVSDVKLMKALELKKDQPLSLAISFMHDNAVDLLPLVDGGQLYGVISYQDILKKYLNWSAIKEFKVKFNKSTSTKSAEGDLPRLSSVPVSSFGTTDNLFTVSSKDDLKKAVKVMAENNFNTLPVVDVNGFKGILSIKNILKLIGEVELPVNYNIKFVGLSELNWHPYEMESLKKIVSNESFKLQRMLHNEFMIVLHIKEYDKAGKRKKYSVHIKVEFPGKMISVSQDDWDWRKAVHKTFVNAQNKLGGQFKKPVKMKVRGDEILR